MQVTIKNKTVTLTSETEAEARQFIDLAFATAPKRQYKKRRNVDHTPTQCIICGRIFNGPRGMHRHQNHAHRV